MINEKSGVHHMMMWICG